MAFVSIPLWSGVGIGGSRIGLMGSAAVTKNIKHQFDPAGDAQFLNNSVAAHLVQFCAAKSGVRGVVEITGSARWSERLVLIAIGSSYRNMPREPGSPISHIPIIPAGSTGRCVLAQPEMER